MAYFGNEPAKVAVKVGSGVITATELADDSITTADIIDDAITPNQLDEDGTGFQVGTLGVGAAVSGGHALLVNGSSSFSANVLGANFVSGANTNYYLDPDGTSNLYTVQMFANSSVQGSATFTVGTGLATFGGNVKINSSTNPTLELDAPSGERPIINFDSGDATEGHIYFQQGSATKSYIQGGITGNEAITFFTGGTTQALKLDSSQNATFAGTVSNTGLIYSQQSAHEDGIRFRGANAGGNNASIYYGKIGLGSGGYLQVYAEGNRSIDLKSGRQIRFFTSTDNSTYLNSVNFNDDGTSTFKKAISIDTGSTSIYPKIEGKTSAYTLWKLEQWYANEGFLGIYRDDSLKIRLTGGHAGVASYIDNGAKLGIGIQAPAAKLHIKDDGAIGVIIENDSDDAALKLDGKDTALYFTNYGSNKWKIYSTNDADKTFFIRNETHSSTAMSITNGSSNNVTFTGTITGKTDANISYTAGNAITTPTGAGLHMEGSDIVCGRIFWQGYQADGGELVGVNNETDQLVLYNYHDGKYLTKWKHDNTIMYTGASIEIGGGVSSNMSGSSAERYVRIRRYATIGSGTIGHVSFSGGSDGGHSYGGLYCSATSTSRGNFEFLLNNGAAFAERATLYYDGNFSIDGSYSSSDLTFKKNVKTIASGLDTINAMRGVTFNWKANVDKDSDIKQYGMIAQEVEEIIPELVKDYGDAKKKQLNYVAIVPVLIEAVKELSAKVKALENA